ncbi:MAG: hypothetical protein RPU64_00625 [Candidatus Sedimenticola sp. (ex Thyasira tokunagai)]
MNRTGDTIDLDALFDMLNLADQPAGRDVASSKQAAPYFAGLVAEPDLQLDSINSLEDLISGGEISSDPS